MGCKAVKIPKLTLLVEFDDRDFLLRGEVAYLREADVGLSYPSVNPSLSYMALTARAAHHAVSELNKMNI